MLYYCLGRDEGKRRQDWVRRDSATVTNKERRCSCDGKVNRPEQIWSSVQTAASRFRQGRASGNCSAFPGSLEANDFPAIIRHNEAQEARAHRLLQAGVLTRTRLAYHHHPLELPKFRDRRTTSRPHVVRLIAKNHISTAKAKMTIRAIEKVSVGQVCRCLTILALGILTRSQNGLGAFILQCKRLDIHYCDYSGSSKGMK